METQIVTPLIGCASEDKKSLQFKQMNGNL